MVGSIKGALRKSLGRCSLTRIELETVLAECEACVNCRPLTYVGSENDDVVLTPSHFLLGKITSVKIHPLNEELLTVISSSDLIRLNEAQQERFISFWKKWADVYLKELPQVVTRFKHQGTLGVGSVVMVRDDNQPRLKWPLGIIEEIFPGKDGIVRAVKVRTARGSFLKPVQKLHSLEIPVYDGNDLSSERQDTTPSAGKPAAEPGHSSPPCPESSTSLPRCPKSGPPPPHTQLPLLRRSGRRVKAPEVLDL